jgi:hypothetical protein
LLIAMVVSELRQGDCGSESDAPDMRAKH